MKCRQELGSNYQNQIMDSRRILETVACGRPTDDQNRELARVLLGLYGTQSDFKVEVFCEQTSQIVTQNSRLFT